MSSPLNESIVEDAALEWFGELGYAVGHGPHLAPGEPAAERQSFGEVVLVGRLREAIRRLNPAIPEEAREEALRKVLRVGTPALVQTNRAFHWMLRDGVPVEYPRPDGSIAGDHVRLVDFADALSNDWLAVNQFTVIEGQHNRRSDIVVFVNGLSRPDRAQNASDEGATIWSFAVCIVDRLHRHAHREDGREYAGGLWGLHQHLRYPARRRRQGHGADLLLESHFQAEPERRRAAQAERGIRGDHRRRGADQEGEAQAEVHPQHEAAAGLGRAFSPRAWWLV